MRQFLGFPYPEEAGLAPSWPAGVARDGKDEKTAPTEAMGSILAGGREGEMEILARVPVRSVPVWLIALIGLALFAWPASAAVSVVGSPVLSKINPK
jgi:hypothetical protein